MVLHIWLFDFGRRLGKLWHFTWAPSFWEFSNNPLNHIYKRYRILAKTCFRKNLPDSVGWSSGMILRSHMGHRSGHSTLRLSQYGVAVRKYLLSHIFASHSLVRQQMILFSHVAPRRRYTKFDCRGIRNGSADRLSLLSLAVWRHARKKRM